MNPARDMGGIVGNPAGPLKAKKQREKGATPLRVGSARRLAPGGLLWGGVHPAPGSPGREPGGQAMVNDLRGCADGVYQLCEAAGVSGVRGVEVLALRNEPHPVIAAQALSDEDSFER